MTHNEELLLKDLCGRLPYGVKVEIYNHWRDEYEDETLTLENYAELIKTFSIEDIKPYLFPLSSMTVKQRDSYRFLTSSAHASPAALIDFFHKNHIDYKGMISKRLAKDATNLNIYQL